MLLFVFKLVIFDVFFGKVIILCIIDVNVGLKLVVINNVNIIMIVVESIEWMIFFLWLGIIKVVKNGIVVKLLNGNIWLLGKIMVKNNVIGIINSLVVKVVGDLVERVVFIFK